MWPWGHLAVGYLCYAAWTSRRDGEQTALGVAAVTLGSQFPDLVDKPLAWTVAVLPSGRSLAHSLLVAAVVTGLAYWVCRWYRREDAAVAFAIGYLAHSLADLGPGVVWGLLRGDWSQLQWTTYLVWPLLPAPPYPHDNSFAEHVLAFAFEPYVLAQLLLFGVAIVVWVRSGAPGLGAIRHHSRR